jgi:hypothetical protein
MCTLMAADVTTQITFGDDPQMVQLGQVRLSAQIVDEVVLMLAIAENKRHPGLGCSGQTGWSKS